MCLSLRADNPHPWSAGVRGSLASVAPARGSRSQWCRCPVWGWHLVGAELTLESPIWQPVPSQAGQRRLLAPSEPVGPPSLSHVGLALLHPQASWPLHPHVPPRGPSLLWEAAGGSRVGHGHPHPSFQTRPAQSLSHPAARQRPSTLPPGRPVARSSRSLEHPSMLRPALPAPNPEWF